MSTSTMYVPDLPTLYEQVRGTKVDPRFPLSEGEIRSLQGKFDPRFKRFGIQQFTVEETLHLMDIWIDRNVRMMDAQRREANRLAYEARKHSPHGSDRSFVNQLFSEMKPKSDGPRPQHRHHRALSGARRDPNAPKVYGEMTRSVKPPKPEKDTAKKGGKQKGSQRH